jgi:hypothetical protein
MPGHIPLLDERSLARLREYVISLRRDTNGVLPLAQLVGLAGDVHSPVGITLDLRASETLVLISLGQDVEIVVRPPASRIASLQILLGFGRPRLGLSILMLRK